MFLSFIIYSFVFSVSCLFRKYVLHSDLCIVNTAMNKNGQLCSSHILVDAASILINRQKQIYRY